MNYSMLLRFHAKLYRLKITRFISSHNGDNDPKCIETTIEKEKDSKDETKVKSSTLKLKLEDGSSEEKREAAKKKLLSLLSEIKVDPAAKTNSSLNLARAVKRQLKVERFKDVIQKKEENKSEVKLQKAAEEVAHSVKGDPQKTLSELNEKLRLLNLAKGQTKVEAIEENVVLDEDVTKNLMSSVEKVASTVTDIPSEVPKSELTRRLLRLSAESQDADATPRKSIDELVKGMKVAHRTLKTEQEIKGIGVSDDSRKLSKPAFISRRTAQFKSINLFDASPLGVFDASKVTASDMPAKKSVWQRLEEKKLKLLVQFAPTNGFEEMIMWTEQGKHWKFPIDNEIDMGEEENVGFHEHVFLEQHLHGFPTKGPIRHFMELVTVGLSKNPYITVQRKIENIDWFRDYFKEKEHILRETGALG